MTRGFYSGAMQLDIRGGSESACQDERRQVERRLLFALGRFARHLGRVQVWLGDVNGPRGGVDKTCRIVAHVRGVGQVVIEDADAVLPAAVARAAERAERAVARALERQRRLQNEVEVFTKRDRG